MLNLKEVGYFSSICWLKTPAILFKIIYCRRIKRL